MRGSWRGRKAGLTGAARPCTWNVSVRALNPQPGVWFERGGERIKVLQADVVERAGPPGRILDEHLTVACGEAALRLTLLQRAGRRPTPAEPFLRGFPLPLGTQLA